MQSYPQASWRPLTDRVAGATFIRFCLRSITRTSNTCYRLHVPTFALLVFACLASRREVSTYSYSSNGPIKTPSTAPRNQALAASDMGWGKDKMLLVTYQAEHDGQERQSIRSANHAVVATAAQNPAPGDPQRLSQPPLLPVAPLTLTGIEGYDHYDS